MEDSGRNIKINLAVVTFIIGLILFTIGLSWNLKRHIGYLFGSGYDIPDFDIVFYPGLYNIGIILVVFGIVTFLYDHTSKLIPLRNKVLYQLVIMLGFLFALMLEIISRVMQYSAYQNRNGDFMKQLSLTFIVNMLAKFGLILMLFMILLFILKLYGMDKYRSGERFGCRKNI